MIYFSKDFVSFFKELEKNNSKEWFDANRKRYEKEVREPWKVFVNALIAAYEKEYGDVPMTAKESVTRINRDIRFSKDKTPYKDHTGAMISRYGKKDMSRPGIYVQANHNDIRMYSGTPVLDKDQLYKVREAISSDLKGFQKVINAKSFKSTFSEILGEKNKRIPKEFMEAAEKEPLIFNKGFYYYFKLPVKTLHDKNLINLLMKEYKKAKHVNEFFEKALS